MTRALVTGSTGGVGANLISALNDIGVEVVGLRRKSSPEEAVSELKMDSVIGDLLDPESLRKAVDGVDWVFHVAAVADDWNFPADWIYRVNVDGTRNMLSAALDAGVKRFVYTSSTAALGVPDSEGQILDETHSYNLKPHQWAYSYSKYLAQQVVDEYVEKGLPALVVQPSVIMGPRDLKFISGELIVRTLKRQIFPFPAGGLNMIDTRDVVQGQVTAIQKGVPGERYLLTGNNLTHTEALNTIGEVLGVPIKRLKIPRWTLPPLAQGITLLQQMGIKLPVERNRVLISGKYLYYDNTKAVKHLGLKLRPFADTVKDTYLWYADNNYFQRRGISSEMLPDILSHLV